MGRIGRFSAAGLVGIFVTVGGMRPAWADIAPNSLRLSKTSTHVVLTWTAGTGPYAVFRSTVPGNFAFLPNYIGETSGTSYSDPLAPLTEPLYFYLVGDRPQCLTNPECNDGNPCNGTELCNYATGTCKAGTPLVCNDGIACTSDSCSPASGCQYAPIDSVCNDSNPCTNDTCTAGVGCGHTNAPDYSACGSGLWCVAGSCTTSCFAAGTPVRTASGLRAIEDLEPGDLIATVFPNGESGFTPLRELERRQVPRLVTIALDGGETIRVTGEHHFWVAGSRWVRASELTATDALSTFDQRSKAVRAVDAAGLAAVDRTAALVPVYNLRLDDAGAYFVGTSGVLTASCHLTLNLSDLPRTPRAVEPAAPGAAAGAPLALYDSKAASLWVHPAGGGAPRELPSMSAGTWARRIGTLDGYLIVLDVEHRALKWMPVDGLEAGVSTGPAASVSLVSTEVPYDALLHDDLIFVSYFSGNVVEVYRWTKATADAPPAPTYVHRYVFESKRELGLSGMAVAGDRLLVAASGWQCKSGNCARRFGEPRVFVAPLDFEAVEPYSELAPANVNPVGFYRHGPTSALYLLNSGDSVGGYSSLQRVGSDLTLGAELRLPDNARIDRAFPLGPDRFALLQMTGDRVFVIDAVRDRLEGVYAFDGARFQRVGTDAVPDRNRAALHDVLADPTARGTFYFIDSKGRQLVRARYEATRGFEVVETIPLPGSELPSWGVWLGDAARESR